MIRIALLSLVLVACGPMNQTPDAGPPVDLQITPTEVTLTPGELTGFRTVITNRKTGENVNVELSVEKGELEPIAANLLQYRAPMATGSFTLRMSWRDDPSYFVETKITVASPVFEGGGIPSGYVPRPDSVQPLPNSSVVIVSEPGLLYRWDVATNTFSNVKKMGQRRAQRIALSRDRKWIFTSDIIGPLMIDAATLDPFTEFEFKDGNVFGLASAPGNALWIGWRPSASQNGGNVTRITLSDGKRGATYNAGGVDQPKVALSPDDSQIIAFDELRTATLQASTGVFVSTLSSGSSADDMAFSVDGRTLAYATGRSGVFIDWDTRQVLHETTMRQGVAVDPLGIYTVFGVIDGGRKNLVVYDQRGGIKGEVRSRPAEDDLAQRHVRRLFFTGDGQFLIVLEGTDADQHTVVLPRSALPQ